MYRTPFFVGECKCNVGSLFSKAVMPRVCLTRRTIGCLLRLQQKTVQHQESIFREYLFTYFLISDIVQQVKDRKLKAVFFKNSSFIKYI